MPNDLNAPNVQANGTPLVQPVISEERIVELVGEAFRLTQTNDSSVIAAVAVRLGLQEMREVASRVASTRAERCRDLEADSGALGFKLVAEHFVSCASVLQATSKEIRAITIDGEVR